MTRDIQIDYRFSDQNKSKKDEPAQPPGIKKPGTDRDQISDPPDSIRNPMPGVDPQQTPGTDHPPAERN